MLCEDLGNNYRVVVLGVRHPWLVPIRHGNVLATLDLPEGSFEKIDICPTSSREQHITMMTMPSPPLRISPAGAAKMHAVIAGNFEEGIIVFGILRLDMHQDLISKVSSSCVNVVMSFRTREDMCAIAKYRLALLDTLDTTQSASLTDQDFLCSSNPSFSRDEGYLLFVTLAQTAMDLSIIYGWLKLFAHGSS